MVADAVSVVAGPVSVVCSARVVVGVDPHKKTHTVVAVEAATGAQVGRHVTVADDPDSVGKLLAWAVKVAAGRSVGWAIEDGRGLAGRLAVGLVVAGQHAVWVPTRLVAAERRGGGKKGKSDPIDALAAARAVLNGDNTRYLAPVTTGEPGAEIGHLVAARRDKLAERTRLINRLRWNLHHLTAGGQPGDLTTLKAPRLLAARLAQLPAGVLRDLIIAACGDLGRLTRQIKDLQADITSRVTDLCPNLLAVPGVGAITAATFLAELGDPARIHSSAALARLAGTAPIPVWSSNTPRYRLDRGGNRRLNTALHTIALTQTRTHPAAQALITKHQPTKGKRGALRVLKRHLTNIVYRALQADMTALTSTNTAA
jgi:transposase